MLPITYSATLHHTCIPSSSSLSCFAMSQTSSSPGHGTRITSNNKQHASKPFYAVTDCCDQNPTNLMLPAKPSLVQQIDCDEVQYLSPTHVVVCAIFCFCRPYCSVPGRSCFFIPVSRICLSTTHSPAAGRPIASTKEEKSGRERETHSHECARARLCLSIDASNLEF